MSVFIKLITFPDFYFSERTECINFGSFTIRYKCYQFDLGMLLSSILYFSQSENIFGQLMKKFELKL